MKAKIYCILAFAILLVSQSCKKNEIDRKTTLPGSIKKQKWVPGDPIADGVYKLQNANGKCFEASGTDNGNVIRQNTYTSLPAQQWKFVNLGGGYYKILNYLSGKALDVPNSSSAQNLQLQQWDYLGNNNQIWKVEYLGSWGLYKITNKSNGLVVTLNNNTTAQYEKITQTTYTADAAHVWIPTQVTPAIAVANILKSNMIVQREKPFIAWGKAAAGNTISVKASWNSTTYSAVADASDKWQVSIPATQATSVAQTLAFSQNGQSEVILTNILIGDVWICSGQSNMLLKVDGTPYSGGPTIGADAEIALADWRIRLIEVGADFTANPIDTLNKYAYWKICTKATAGSFNAVPYYFGKKLFTSLNVPIGLVVSCAGGTSAEFWTGKETFDSNQTIKNYYNQDSKVSDYYNAMIHPLGKLSIKGAIWYQGEDNRNNDPAMYSALMNGLIGNWRTLFNQQQLPFYLVQVAPYLFDGATDPTLNNYSKIREAQAGLRSLPYTGIAVTMDVGNLTDVHPKDKKPVGERLAAVALNKTYGLTAVACLGPQPNYAGFTQGYEGNNYIATIKYITGTANGLTTKNNTPLAQVFFVAGSDHIFRQATASISGTTVKLIVPAGTPLPVIAARYAFTNIAMTNLQNSDGLPAEPFRTDNWTN